LKLARVLGFGAAKQMNSQPWLVTGAAGFLGSHVVEYLLSCDIPVIGVDNLTSGKWQFLAPFATHQRFKFICQDIRDEAALISLFRREKPANVIHLAALHFIPAAMRNPSLTVSLNVHGTQCVLSACRESNVGRFWFASTADVYQAADKPHRESGTLGPFNIYGLTKWMGEKLVQLEADAHPERHFVIGRLFNLYGPRETNPHILPEIIAQLRDGGSHVLRLGNITPKRDLVPVSDAAHAVVEMTEKSVPGVTIANVGTGLSVSMQEVVERIADLTRRPLRIEIDPAKVRPVERPHLQADVDILRAMIGWAPHADLSRGLSELLRFEGVMV
jgi:UDP-glucose 4-epimerase